jgi:hypothetical protein
MVWTSLIKAFNYNNLKMAVIDNIFLFKKLTHHIDPFVIGAHFN